MPIVVVTRGSGGTVSGGDADTVDGRHADEFALLSGATFAGGISAPSIGVTGMATLRMLYVGRESDLREAQIPDAGGAGTSLVIGGWGGGWACNVHDGTGRVNYRWNATVGTSPRYARGGEPALEWDVDGWGSYGLTVRYAGGGSAGDGIVWQNIMSAGLTGLRVWGPVKPKTYQRSALPSADLLAGMIAYVSDGPDGPCLAVYDGTNWRAVALGAAL